MVYGDSPHMSIVARPWLCSKNSLLQTPATTAAPIGDIARLVTEEKGKMAEPHNDFVLLLRNTWAKASHVAKSDPNGVAGIILPQEGVVNFLKTIESNKKSKATKPEIVSEKSG